MRIALIAAVLGAAGCEFGSTGAAGSASAGMPGDADGTGSALETGAGVPSTDSAAQGTASSDAADGSDGATAAITGTDAASSTGALDPASSTGDTAGSTTADDGTTGEPVVPVGPFDAPVAIAELNSDDDDDDPSVTADELFIVFNSARSGASDIWWSSRESVDDPWDLPQPLTELNVGYITGPSVTPDGLVLLWSTNAAPSVGLDVWMSTRADRQAGWSEPARVDALSSDSTDIAPRWFPALGVAWICSDRPGSAGETDAWVAPWAQVDPVPGTPGNVAELATTFADCAVGLSADGREAFMETTRPGGAGEWDLWRVYRDDPEAAFVTDDLQPATELNTTGFDIDPWPSADGHRLYMASDRDGGLDLFVAYRED